MTDPDECARIDLLRQTLNNEKCMSLGMEIRPFKTSDAEIIVEFVKEDLRIVHKQFYSAEETEILISWCTKERMIELSEEKNRHFLVATIQNKAVGIITFIEDEIEKLYVDPKLHGNGIGRSLLKRIEEIAKNNKIVKLKVQSKTNAVGFYEKLGFHHLFPFKESEYEDEDVLMEKIL